MEERADVPRTEAEGARGAGSASHADADAGSEVGSEVEAIADLLHAVARRLRRGARDELAPLGLTWAQLRVLRTLGRAGEPLRMGDLARALGIVARSATSVVDALEAGGFVARQRDPSDRRATRVALTEAGRAVLSGIQRRRSAVAADLFGRLSAEDRAELRRLLARLAEDAGGNGPGDDVVSGPGQPRRSRRAVPGRRPRPRPRW